MSLPLLRIGLMIARGSFVAPVERAVNRTAAKTGIWVAFGAIAFLFAVVALVAVSLGAWLALEPRLGAAGAAFSVAGGGLLFALVALGIGALLAGRVDAPAPARPAPAPAPAATASAGDDPLDTLLKAGAVNPTIVAAGALLLGFLVGRRR